MRKAREWAFLRNIMWYKGALAYIAPMRRHRVAAVTGMDDDDGLKRVLSLARRKEEEIGFRQTNLGTRGILGPQLDLRCTNSCDSREWQTYS